MKNVSKSRKQVTGNTLRKAFHISAMIYEIYGNMRRWVDSRNEERFLSGGITPKGMPGGKFISEKGPERIVNSRDDMHELNGTLTWEARFTPPDVNSQSFEEVIKHHNQIVYPVKDNSQPTTEGWDNLKARFANRESEEDYAKRVEQTKKDFQPINDFLRSVKQPELPHVIHFNTEEETKCDPLPYYSSDCISTDCCGKCEKDKPE